MSESKPSFIRDLGRDEILIRATLDDDPRSKQARVIIGEEEVYIDRDAIVYVARDFRP